MKKYIEALTRCKLFDGMAPNEIEAAVGCLGGQVKNCPRDSAILRAGDNLRRVGILLSGSMAVVREDYLGNKTILTKLQPGELFAEVFVCAGVERSPVDVFCTSDCRILTLDYGKIISPQGDRCSFHSRLVGNMLGIVAGKALAMSRRTEILSCRTIRDKLMTYLTIQAGQSDSCTIPFSRQELADFLCTDRSALSRELGRMQNQGLLRFKGNRFTLLRQQLYRKHMPAD